PTASSVLSSLSLHDALPIFIGRGGGGYIRGIAGGSDLGLRHGGAGRVGDGACNGPALGLAKHRHSREHEKECSDRYTNNDGVFQDRKSTRLNSSHVAISYAV